MSRTGKSAFSVVSPSCSAILLATLPKCPACLVFLLAVPLLFLLMPGCRRCSRRPLYLAVAGDGNTGGRPLRYTRCGCICCLFCPYLFCHSLQLGTTARSTLSLHTI